MRLEQYEILSGRSLKQSQQRFALAQIKRMQSKLESLLGYTLDPAHRLDNNYTESGKASTDCVCLDIDVDNLDPADAVQYAYRTFPYNPNDRYFAIDPFTAIHKVKLVRNNVTIKTFEDVRAEMTDGWGKYIEVCPNCYCVCECNDCVQLAVDANWCFSVDSSVGYGYPEDLLYLWVEMVDHAIDCKGNIKSESLGSHSYTKFEKDDPLSLPENQAIIRKYRGGLINTLPV